MTTLTELKPLSPQAWDESIHDIREQLGTPPNVHATLANHPPLLKAWMVFRNHMVHGVTVDRRDLEVVILRTAHRVEAEYEWMHHAQIALEYGLTSRQIGQIAQDSEAGEWSARDQLLLAAADECADQHQITAKTRDGLLAHFNGQQMLDLLFTIGMYTTLAFMIKTLEVPMEARSSGFSQERLDES